jgi:hypothetical protein
MKFTTTENERMIPNNISDVGLLDDDSGLRLFRGMMSPWGAIKSFKETYNFLVRHGVMVAVGAMNAYQIIEPDQEKRQGAMSGWWKQSMLETWGPDDAMGQVAEFEYNYSIPPFIRQSMYRTANYADWGDEMMLMPGEVRSATNDRIEKEIHQCMVDIVGPDACDLSEGGGQWFCKGLYGPNGIGYENYNGYLVQRKGCGDPVCRVVWEAKHKFGEHANHPGGEDWEEWGPPNSGYAADMLPPRKDECEFLNTGFYTAPLGQEFTAGEMFKMNSGWPMAYSYHVLEGLRSRNDGEVSDGDMYTLRTMLDATGKIQFAEAVTRKAIRAWMDVPADVDDCRVMGGYISMIWQSKAIEWRFIEFTEDQVVIDCDSTSLFMYGMYPEYARLYEALFNGMVKSLVNTSWVVECDYDYLEEENMVRYTIKRAVYGNRRQKPDYDYDRTAEDKAKAQARKQAMKKIEK